MRTTITIDDELLAKAKAYSQVSEVGPLVRRALEELIQTEVARRLIALGGSDPDAWAPNEGEVEGDTAAAA
jgi:Arc/MetJ family transcription regulator